MNCTNYRSIASRRIGRGNQHPNTRYTVGFMTPARISTRAFLLCAGALLTLMTAAEIGSMLQDSQTVDESYHLLAGYQFLKTGIPPARHEQPPLSEVTAALPLLPLELR